MVQQQNVVIYAISYSRDLRNLRCKLTAPTLTILCTCLINWYRRIYDKSYQILLHLKNVRMGNF